MRKKERRGSQAKQSSSVWVCSTGGIDSQNGEKKKGEMGSFRGGKNGSISRVGEAKTIKDSVIGDDGYLCRREEKRATSASRKYGSTGNGGSVGPGLSKKKSKRKRSREKKRKSGRKGLQKRL